MVINSGGANLSPADEQHLGYIQSGEQLGRRVLGVVDCHVRTVLLSCSPGEEERPAFERSRTSSHDVPLYYCIGVASCCGTL